jgi:hypothetical protein
MFRRVIGFILVFSSLMMPSISNALGSGVVIGSYKVASEGKAADEFIEIYNSGLVSVNINGWQLAKKTVSGNKYNLISSFPSCLINPGESIIVGHKDSTESPDIFYTSDYSLSEDNTIVLFSDAGKTVADKVGYGKATDFEGKAVGAAGTDAWTRIDGIDTGNNSIDFKKVVKSVDLSGLAITEIMPAPETGEEWIEIYNSEMSKDVGGLIIADKLGSIKKFTVPVGTNIQEGGYLVFYKDKTGITLNDDGDGVVITDPSGNIINDSGESFGKAIKGSSYAFDGNAWKWTGKPTPGSINIISSAATSVSINSKKRAGANTKGAEAPKKGTVPTAEVLGSQDQAGSDDIFKNGSSENKDNDRIFGYALIVLAVLGGVSYTIFVNKEKLIEVFRQERTGYYRACEDFGSKIKGWRNFSIVRRFRRR